MAQEIHYYHLRCGGKLVYTGPGQGEETYRCDLCDGRGVPFTEPMVVDDDRDEDSDRFSLLPTTFMAGHQTITVCALIMTQEDFARLTNQVEARLKQSGFGSE